MAGEQYMINKLSQEQLERDTKQTIDELVKINVKQYVVNINEPDEPVKSGLPAHPSTLFAPQKRAGTNQFTPRNYENILFFKNSENYVGYIRQTLKTFNIYNIYLRNDFKGNVEEVIQVVRKHFRVSSDDDGRSKLIRRLFDKL